MDAWNLSKVVYALRAARVPVSTQDVADTLYCLASFPELPSQTILQTFLIHRSEDNHVFSLIWHILFESSVVELPDPQPYSSASNGGLGVGRGCGGQTLSPTTSDLPKMPLKLSLPLNLTNLSFEDDQFNQFFQALLATTDYYTWINNVDLSYLRNEISSEQWQDSHDYAEHFTADLRQKIMSWLVEKENNWLPVLNNSWRLKPLQSLSENERSLMQRAIQQWGRKLAVRQGRRWKNSRPGQLDPYKTIAKSFQGDGKIVQLYYRRRSPRHPELIVLCDVSNSVAPYAEFLLFLVSRLRRRFRRVRLFFFVDVVWEVPPKFWDLDMDDWQEEITSTGNKAGSGFSDYGKVFKELTSFLPEIPASATVLILGDGKNNFRPAQPEYLAQIRNQVRKVIWLNPLPETEWNDRDNVLPFYSSLCTHVYRCRTADDLQHIALSLT